MGRSQTLYPALVAAFSVIVVVSNILSAKLVKLPFLSIAIPAGLVTYPLTFVLSDLVTEIFGPKKAKFMVYTALCMSLLSFGMIQLSLKLPTFTQEDQTAFEAILGLSGLRIFSSLISYLVSQVVDIQLYAAIKRWTDSKHLWLRNNGSVFVSQLVDTVLIDLIFLWWGLGMPMALVFPTMVLSYAYKAFFSVACTPLFYFFVSLLRGKTAVEKTLKPQGSAV